MADLKISQLNSLSGSSLADTDVLAVVDTSASETKKITSKELVQYGYGLVNPSTLDGDIIEPGTTSARGTVQLTNSTGSTSTTTAATPNAVKSAYDLANAALPKAGGTMTGQILGDDSTSASTPGYAFDGDPDTGLLRTGANELGLVTGGTSRLTIDASGNVVIPGNFTVQGTTTTIDTTTLVVEDKNIEMGAVATPTDVTADGGGITLKGTTDKTINWVDATDAWTSSERFSVPTGTAAAPTLTFTGDPNTGVYSPGADQVAISTGGSGRLFVNSSGNIGVASSSVQSLGANYSTLEIKGKSGGFGGGIILSPSDAATVPAVWYYDGLCNFGSLNSTPLSFLTNGTEKLRITSAGLVGVGTSSPVDRLHVDGRIAVTTDSSTPTTGEAFFYKSVTGAVMSGFGATIETGSAGSRQARVSVDSSGRVGIGTSTPGSGLLDVRGTSNNQQILQVSNSAGTTDGSVTNAVRFTCNGNSNWANARYNAYTHIWGVNDASGQEAARLTASGQLLVGTSSARSTYIGGAATPFIQFEGATSIGSRTIGQTYGEGANSSGPLFAFAKHRGSTVGAITAVADGDECGQIIFQGSDGTNFIQAASIRGAVDGTPAANVMPGRLVFSVTPNSKATPEEAMRIKNSKIINFANAPTYADNAAATAGGLVAGDVYKKADGTLMITF